MKASRMLKGYLFAIISAVIYGCMPLMAKHIYADGVNAMTLVFLRNVLALPVLAVLAKLQNKTLKIPAKSLGAIGLLAAFGCCATPVLLFSSYHYIPSGTATVFHFIYPCLVVVIGVIFLKKRVQVGTLLSLLLCLGGICLFYKPGAAFHWGGSGLATGSLVLPQSLLGWGLCLLFALGVTVGAVVLFQQGTFLIGGERASILSTLEPITSVVVGVLFLNETIGLRDYMGAALVVAASVLIAVLDMKK